MKIVHVCRVGWPSVGGMESSVGGLAAAQAARGHEVSVVTLDRGPDGARLAPVAGPVSYVRLRRIGPRRYPFALGLLRHLRGADVVHAHGLDGLTDEAVLARRWHGARVGVSTHGGYFHTGRHPRIKDAWLRTGTAAVLRAADAVWFTSDADRQTLAPAGVSGEVMPDGVDVARFAGVVRTPEPGRWLVPGRVDAHKGLEDLIDALSVLRYRDARPFRVDVAGPVRDPGLLRALIDRAAAFGLADRVHFVGPVDALDVAFARAELCLLPSRYEGFGIALVEAMAAGVPVLARRIPAFEALLRDGVDGWLVDWADSEAMAAKLSEVRERDHAAISASAREAARPHGWDRRIDEWEEAYARLVARPYVRHGGRS